MKKSKHRNPILKVKSRSESEEDDMFASDKEDPVDDDSSDKKKRGFDIDEFEEEQGLKDYIFNEELDGNTPEIAEKDDLKDSRNQIQMEAFNLREEVESGKFDQDMNYIQGKKDSDDEEEPWMAEASAEDILKARKAQESNSFTENKPLRVVLDILQDLISLLEPAETSMEALSRLRPAKRKRAKNLKSEADQARKNMVFKITECCESLVNEKGISSAYDMSREELMRAYAQETGQSYQAKGTKRTIDEMEKKRIWRCYMGVPLDRRKRGEWTVFCIRNEVLERYVFRKQGRGASRGRELAFTHVSQVDFEDQI
ncbi:hypothetical protein HF325_003303 [Metschnikowia pulcherrima]|uniref:Uncharacterized protein n=1 Tax=Metschnikowia pulcherrima TaxID=27326 RepID=A0A8H7LC14_9ASCO|nr:hypothetical protein HF325_003303 [Metschnikowia pulcherrima]